LRGRDYGGSTGLVEGPPFYVCSSSRRVPSAPTESHRPRHQIRLVIRLRAQSGGRGTSASGTAQRYLPRSRLPAKLSATHACAPISTPAAPTASTASAVVLQAEHAISKFPNCGPSPRQRSGHAPSVAGTRFERTLERARAVSSMTFGPRVAPSGVETRAKRPTQVISLKQAADAYGGFSTSPRAKRGSSLRAAPRLEGGSSLRAALGATCPGTLRPTVVVCTRSLSVSSIIIGIAAEPN
jgi:hypothetical protein